MSAANYVTAVNMLNSTSTTS